MVRFAWRIQGSTAKPDLGQGGKGCGRKNVKSGAFQLIVKSRTNKNGFSEESGRQFSLPNVKHPMPCCPIPYCMPCACRMQNTKSRSKSDSIFKFWETKRRSCTEYTQYKYHYFMNCTKYELGNPIHMKTDLVPKGKQH